MKPIQLAVLISTVLCTFTPTPSQYNNQCLRCVLTQEDKKNFTLSYFENLQKI